MSGPRADTLVLFGITGDLARKLVLPALYQLAARGEVTVPIVGVALSTWNDDELHQHIRDAVAAVGPIDEAVLAKLLARTSLVRGDYADAATFAELAQHVSGASFLAHYLAVPPSLFAIIAEGLTAAGLAGHARLVVEKPFGHDLASARDLNVRLHRCLPEERIFRVDHYLGKEPVQDLSWSCASLTYCSSRSGTATTSIACRSPWRRPTTSPTAAPFTTPWAPSAM
jgi:glucose-6-phosphate 1-dehydrogenase